MAGIEKVTFSSKVRTSGAKGGKETVQTGRSHGRSVSLGIVLGVIAGEIDVLRTSGDFVCLWFGSLFCISFAQTKC